jgi:uncharacterized protein
VAEVFADSLYWIAMASDRDQWHQAALQASQRLGAVKILTSEAVLLEFLAGLSDRGRHMRRKAVETVRALQVHPNVEVVQQTHALFEAGLHQYEQRPDKEYSLVDCISMHLMRERGLSDALTHDHHFEQEGFRALLRE